MRNKQLLNRRLSNLEGALKGIRSSLGQNDIAKGKELNLKALEILEEVNAIVERED